MSGLRFLGVIPARHASTRFPGKPLADLWGRPLVWHTWRRASLATSFDRVVIATDHHGIAEVARGFGAEVVLTRPEHPSGTDRCAEVAEQLGGAEYIVNIQGDEPLIDPTLLDALCAELALGRSDIVTAATELRSAEDLLNPNIVKVVPGPGRAWYFSRAPIPYPRDEANRAALLAGEHPLWWHHVGLYGYTAEALRRFVAHPPTPLELTEQLEQLRALEIGLTLWVLPAQQRSPGIDTPEQLAALQNLPPQLPQET